MIKFKYAACGLFALSISALAMTSYQNIIKQDADEVAQQIAATKLIDPTTKYEGMFDGEPIPPQEDLPKTEIIDNYSTGALVKIQQEIETLRNEIEQLRNELYTANKEIDIYEQSIASKEQSLEDKKAMAKYYIRAYYQTKRDASLQLGFLEANNYKDFLYRYSTTAEIMKRLENSINIDTKETEELEKNKSKVQLKADLYAAALADLEAKNEDLRMKQAELNAFIASHRADLNVELTDAIGKLGDYIIKSNYSYSANRTGKFMTLPVQGEVTSNWGGRNHPIDGDYRHHAGVDLGVDLRTPVKAAADGIVIMASWYGGYGKCVMINHGNDIVSLYGHNDKILVKEGTIVQQGQVIALAGSTGNSTGPHVHFEIRKNGTDIDPYTYVIGR